MQFELVDSLLLPGDPRKPNEDSFAHSANMAVVVDGATGLGDLLMPGPSDAQWIAQFGARRLRAHASEGGEPEQWLAAAAADAEQSFTALRRRAPQENYELPFASLMLAAPVAAALHFVWFGDCAALLRSVEGTVALIGDTLKKRSNEASRAARASATPAAAGVREEFLPALRTSRNRVNVKGSDWLFAPDRACAAYAKTGGAAASPGARLLLASDGFLALASDYGRYTPESLITACEAKGLAALGRELREIESQDPEGRTYPRFKRSDDATALLLILVAKD